MLQESSQIYDFAILSCTLATSTLKGKWEKLRHTEDRIFITFATVGPILKTWSGKHPTDVNGILPGYGYEGLGHVNSLLKQYNNNHYHLHFQREVGNLYPVMH